MIANPVDEKNLQNFLGVKDIPGDVEEEYRIRVKMYHASGSSGPLPPVGLIDLVRFLGHKPPQPKVADTGIDWRTMPEDGSVRVEARFNGQWMKGVYLGGVEGGTLAVRLHGDPVIKECRPHMLRLDHDDVQTEEEKFAAGTEDPDPRAELLEDEDVHGENAEDFDWSAATKGDRVWVRVDGDVQEAAFVRENKDTIRVKFDGQDKELSLRKDEVIYAGA